MKRTIKNIVAAVLCAVVIGGFASCAEEPTIDTKKFQQNSLDAWMAKYVNCDDTVAWRQSNGMYVQVLPSTQPLDESLAPADTIVWVRINYTGRTLQNNVYLTRSENEARWQGTFTERTYYAPDYLYCGSTNTNMIEGQYYALKNEFMIDGVPTKMVQGSKVRLYMTSELAYGSYGTSNNQGYGGQFTLKGNVPTIEDLELVEVVKDPVERENKLVADYAEQMWGMNVADTIAEHFYLDKSNLLDVTLGDTLTVDSTAYLYYKGYYLDGFVFDSNIDSVQLRAFGEITHSDPLVYKPSEDKEELINAFYRAIPGMRYGEWGRMVFTSLYGYGASGYSAALQEEYDSYNNYMSYLYANLYNSANRYNSYYDYYTTNYMYYNILTSSTLEEGEVVTEIPSYTPLVFEFFIAHEGEDNE